MRLIKTVVINNKDSYLLVQCQTFIIIDDRNGVSLYDHNLEHLKDTRCFDEGAVHTIFSSCMKKEVLLYLCEEGKIIYLDLISEKHTTIKLGKYTSHYLYSYYYWWDNKIVLFPILEKDVLLKLNLEKKQFSKINVDEAKKDFYTFYVFWEKVKNLGVIESDVLNQIILYQDNELPLVTIKNLITNEEYSCTIPEIDVHETKFNGHTIAFVAEYNLVIKNVISGKEIALKPKRFHRFLRLIFLDETRVVLLSCDESGTGIDFLQLYDVATIL